jgi:hypothetical protein
MNLFDIDSLNLFASARSECFLEEARRDYIAREYRLSRQRVPSRFRRVIGRGLISAGSRLSGVNSGELRRTTGAA